jgi:hypothetical protein
VEGDPITGGQTVSNDGIEVNVVRLDRSSRKSHEYFTRSQKDACAAYELLGCLPKYDVQPPMMQNGPATGRTWTNRRHNNFIILKIFLQRYGFVVRENFEDPQSSRNVNIDGS